MFINDLTKYHKQQKKTPKKQRYFSLGKVGAHVYMGQG